MFKQKDKVYNRSLITFAKVILWWTLKKVKTFEEKQFYIIEVKITVRENLSLDF